MPCVGVCTGTDLNAWPLCCICDFISVLIIRVSSMSNTIMLLDGACVRVRVYVWTYCFQRKWEGFFGHVFNWIWSVGDSSEQESGEEKSFHACGTVCVFWMFYFLTVHQWKWGISTELLLLLQEIWQHSSVTLKFLFQIENMIRSDKAFVQSLKLCGGIIMTGNHCCHWCFYTCCPLWPSSHHTLLLLSSNLIDFYLFWVFCSFLLSSTSLFFLYLCLFNYTVKKKS